MTRRDDKDVTRNRGAFTLVEVLISIALIAILGSVIYGASTTAMAVTKRSKCAANLKSLGNGLGAYVADHDGSFIPAYQGSFGYWFNELAPYMSGGELDWTKGIYPPWLQCPSKPGLCGYGWNYAAFGQNTSTQTKASYAKIVQVTEPSRTIIMGDSADDPEASRTEHFVIYGTYKKLPKRHFLGTGNYLYVDGHIATMTPDQTEEGLPRSFEKYQGQKNDLLEQK